MKPVIADDTWIPDPEDELLPCYGSSWFISDDREEREAATHICGTCPYRDLCLAFGVACEATAGVFGGRDFSLPEPSAGTLFEEAS